MSEQLTDQEIDFVLERFDQTDHKLQRRLIAEILKRNCDLQDQVAELIAACEWLLASASPSQLLSDWFLRLRAALASIKGESR